MPDYIRKQFIRTYWIAGIFFAVFLVCCTLFLHNLVERNTEASLKFLSNAARQDATALERQIAGDFQTLIGVALCLGRLDVTQYEKIRPILKEINDNNAFTRMGYATVAGKIDLLDINGHTYEQVDISKTDFFRRAMLGENVISPLLKDPFGPGYVSYSAVPVRRDGRIIGVLCAVNGETVLLRLLNGTLFSSASLFSIIDKQGDNMFFVDPGHKQATRLAADNMAKLEDLAFPPAIHDQILRDLKQGKGGAIPLSAQEARRLVIYEPLGVGGWSLLTVISEDAVKQNDGNLMTAALSLIAVALTAFVFFLRRINMLAVKSRKELENIAYVDHLTGCRNLLKFLQDAIDCLDHDPHGQYALWHCDIKKFKYFNDIFGYHTGDNVLRHLAGLLETHCGKNEFFCRVSADNFAGIRPWTGQAELEAFFQTLRHAFNAKHAPQTKGFHLDLDVGVYAATVPREPLSVNEMLNRAIMAQKSVKDTNGSHFALFTEGMRSRVLWETELESSMYQALADGEFQLYLQPKVNIRKGNRIAGAEVLTRWLSPGKGMISPATFIPLFEKNGFIIKMDRYIFEQACRWMRAHLDAGTQPINLAINVSRLGLLQEDFIDFYASVKERYSIPDGILELEFTESIFLNDDAMFRDIVLKLHEHGFLCSLDDFGAGFSSLNVLKNLPIDVLKLDILFFRQNSDTERSRVVIRNIIAMAVELNMKTIAEGVEVIDQVDFLRDMGCDVVQGYVFAKPMPTAEFDQLLMQLNGNPLQYANSSVM